MVFRCRQFPNHRTKAMLQHVLNFNLPTLSGNIILPKRDLLALIITVLPWFETAFFLPEWPRHLQVFQLHRIMKLWSLSSLNCWNSCSQISQAWSRSYDISAGASFAVEMLLRSWFPTNGLLQLSMRASTANTCFSSLGFLGDCISLWWNWGRYAYTKLLSWSSTPVLCGKSKSIFSAGLQLNLVMIAVVFLSFLTVTSMVWSTRILPNGLSLASCTEK